LFVFQESFNLFVKYFLVFFIPNGDVGVVGCLSMRTTQRSIHNFSIVCESTPKKKADSAEKRTRQAEKRRVYNKARKSEVKTRMKKVTLHLLLLFFLFMYAFMGFAFFLFTGEMGMFSLLCGQVFVSRMLRN
jgi:hypothetical protein